jgi:hypothetical protein
MNNKPFFTRVVVGVRRLDLVARQVLPFSNMADSRFVRRKSIAPTTGTRHAGGR